MFTCFHCKTEKPEEEKAEISVIYKIGYFGGGLLLFLFPFWWTSPNWPGATCKECESDVVTKGCVGLYFSIGALVVLIGILVAKIIRSSS